MNQAATGDAAADSTGCASLLPAGRRLLSGLGLAAGPLERVDLLQALQKRRRRRRDEAQGLLWRPGGQAAEPAAAAAAAAAETLVARLPAVALVLFEALLQCSDVTGGERLQGVRLQSRGVRQAGQQQVFRIW
jgi:hypothetical protein